MACIKFSFFRHLCGLLQNNGSVTVYRSVSDCLDVLIRHDTLNSHYGCSAHLAFVTGVFLLSCLRSLRQQLTVSPCAIMYRLLLRNTVFLQVIQAYLHNGYTKEDY